MKSYILYFILLIVFCGNASAQNIDIKILESINGPASPADRTWHNVSNSTYIAIVVAPASMLITGFITDNKDLKIKGLETAASILISQGVSFGLKAIVRRERPYEAYPDLIVGKSKSNGYSFPSGHSSAAFAMATSLSLSFPKWYVIAPSFTYAAAVGYSRMYLGVHYPSDVLAGALIGAGSSFLTWKLQKLLSKKHQHNKGN